MQTSLHPQKWAREAGCEGVGANLFACNWSLSHANKFAPTKKGPSSRTQM